MDSFVAVTGDDENNIIATLLAKQNEVKRPIVLVNKVAYLPIMPTIGLNAVISKQMLTVNIVQQFIQHRQVAAIASVPGVEGQMIEYIAGARGAGYPEAPAPVELSAECSHRRDLACGKAAHSQRRDNRSGR